MLDLQFILERISKLPQATIAKLEGFARGGGHEFALACDMRFAARGKFKFMQMEVGMGHRGAFSALGAARHIKSRASREKNAFFTFATKAGSKSPTILDSEIFRNKGKFIMKAMLVNAYGEDAVFDPEEVPTPEVKPGHVLVKIAASKCKHCRYHDSKNGEGLASFTRQSRHPRNGLCRYDRGDWRGRCRLFDWR